VCCVEVVCAISVRACVRHSRNKDLVIRHSVVFNDSNRSALSLFPSLCCLPVRCSCARARARVCVCVCVCIRDTRTCVYVYMSKREITVYSEWLPFATLQLTTNHSQRLNSGKPLGTGSCE